MKKCLFWTFFLLWAAGLAWLLFYRPASLITKDQFDLLEAGITEVEVAQILGGPPRNECSDPVVVWAPRGDTLNSTRIDPGPSGVTFFQDATGDEYEQVWLSEAGLVVVLFDEAGRLTEKHFSDVHVRKRPTALDWIRSRF